MALVRIVKKHETMPQKMEKFIKDAIILSSQKHSGNLNKVADDIVKKLDDRIGGRFWKYSLTQKKKLLLSGII